MAIYKSQNGLQPFIYSSRYLFMCQNAYIVEGQIIPFFLVFFNYNIFIFIF